MYLLPPEDCISFLREGYSHIENMLLGTKPSFDDIMDCIAAMKQEINHLL